MAIGRQLTIVIYVALIAIVSCKPVANDKFLWEKFPAHQANTTPSLIDFDLVVHHTGDTTTWDYILSPAHTVSFIFNDTNCLYGADIGLSHSTVRDMTILPDTCILQYQGDTVIQIGTTRNRVFRYLHDMVNTTDDECRLYYTPRYGIIKMRSPNATTKLRNTNTNINDTLNSILEQIGSF